MGFVKEEFVMRWLKMAICLSVAMCVAMVSVNAVDPVPLPVPDPISTASATPVAFSTCNDLLAAVQHTQAEIARMQAILAAAPAELATRQANQTSLETTIANLTPFAFGNPFLQSYLGTLQAQSLLNLAQIAWLESVIANYPAEIAALQATLATQIAAYEAQCGPLP